MATPHRCPIGTFRLNFSKTDILSFPSTNLLLAPASPYQHMATPSFQLLRPKHSVSFLTLFFQIPHPSIGRAWLIYFQNISRIHPLFFSSSATSLVQIQFFVLTGLPHPTHHPFLIGSMSKTHLQSLPFLYFYGYHPGLSGIICCLDWGGGLLTGITGPPLPHPV